MPERTPIRWLIVVGLVLVVLACFAPALSNDFVNWDDDLVLTDNAAYRGLSPSQVRWMVTTTHAGHYQPLTWVSYALDHALWGMDPRGYHLTNLLLHALNTVLLWRVLLELLGAGRSGAPLAAAVGSLIFAIHPLRVESVAWATERRDVLSGFFWLLALLAYLQATTHRPRRGLGPALVALVCSLGAKAWGMTFPLVLLILDAHPLRRLAPDPRAVLREKIPFFAVATLAAGIALLAQHGVPEMRSLAEHGLASRMAQAAYGLVFYLGATLWPVHLHPAYLLEPNLDPTRARYLASMAAVVTITTTALLLRRRWPWLLATWAAYVVILAPVLGVVQTGPQLVADRYSYLAMLPWTALLAAGLTTLWSPARAARTRQVVAAASVLVLALLAAATFRQTQVWHDSITLWNHTLAIDPDNWIAYTNRGFASADSDAALADYSAAIVRNPRYALAYFDRGNLRHDRGDLAGAISDHSAVITLQPDDPQAYNNRGWAKQALGDWQGAAGDYARALELAAPDWWARDLVTRNLATAQARITANDR